jgi:hypothetical protein
MDKIGGIEEIISCMLNLKRLREDSLLKYLAIYDNQFLYQKA